MAKGFGISDLASLGFGQVGQLLDTMDMMSKTWSGMALPAALDPTANLEELDKRISDLRAIEQWLALNQNMLRSTIQGLEVQRGTIATLQSFGKAMGATEGAGEGVHAPWNPERLAALFAATQGAAAHATGNGGGATTATPDEDPSTRTGAPAGEEAGGDAGGSGAHADATQLAQAWWNMLNDQFQQLAGAAVGGLAAAGHAGRAEPAGPAAAPGRTTAARGRRARGAEGAASGRKRAPRSP